MAEPSPRNIEVIHPPDPDRIRKILVRANNWIGDVVMLSPAMRALRERFPHARITILAKPWVLEALAGSPWFDDLLPFERDGRHAGLSGFLRMAGELRRKRFHCALLFQNAFEAALLTALAGIPLRVGYATDRRGPLLTIGLPVPESKKPPHRAEEFLGLVRVLGCQAGDLSTHFPADPAERSRILPHLEERVPPTAPLIALHPGASKLPRAWHEERFAEVASRLQENPGAEILLLGDAGEEALLQRIAGRIRKPPLFIPPPPSLKRMAACLQSCHLFIGNDSGPMHVAAALGVPVIAIFGPSAPERTGPFHPGNGFLPITAGFPCSPCRQRFFRECDASPSGKPPCLEAVRVEETVIAARRLLKSFPEGPRRTT